MAARQHPLILGSLIALVTFGGCKTDRVAPAKDPSVAPGRGTAAPSTEGDPSLPGTSKVDQALVQKLAEALSEKGKDYRPRTHHMEGDAPKYTNRLILETSPYLLQHAHNPVNWFPWGEAAFERAKQTGKPVFLSVGYSTCHWCHVMERESFEDEEIAAFLNQHFVSIKVDREVRPDVDSVYMTSVQLLTGRGGWPMTVVMTPDKEPFFAGTYFPPRDGVRGGRKGLLSILQELAQRYRDDRDSVVQQARAVSQRVQQASQSVPGAGLPGTDAFVLAARQLAGSYDPQWGGFGRAPKFPQPARLTFLLRYARRTSDPVAREVVTETLHKMAAGGMYDHVGGGFHRYSTDARWLVPHFEKMLYDNAQLAEAYTAAWRFTADPEFERVSREILDYVLLEMTSPRGGFYSATDADSPTPKGHDEEGWFFTWPLDEIRTLLGDEAALFEQAYGITAGGNFEGRNIPNRVTDDRQLARTHRTNVRSVQERLTRSRKRLYEARAKRPPPLRDDKIIASWNGLMISAFARAAIAFADERYAAAAEKAAELIVSTFRNKDGTLCRTRVVEPVVTAKCTAAFVDDYAAMIRALLDVYELSGQQVWLDHALELQRAQDQHHLDRKNGGYFRTAHNHEELLAREKPLYDGAVPSGNALSAENLLRLYEFTNEDEWRERAETLFGAFAVRLERSPLGSLRVLCALDYYYDVPLEVVIVSPTTRDEGEPLLEKFRSQWVPNSVFSHLTAAEAEQQAKLVPWLEGKAPLDGKATAYVCERGRCELPTSKPAVFAKQLARVNAYPGPPPPRLQAR